MFNKAVSTYPSKIQFIPDRFKTQKMCDKAYQFVPASVPD